MEQKFLRCAHCGKIIAVVKDAPVPTICCGEPMKEIVAGTVEASKEKHIPVIEVKGREVTVTVGSVLHPMTEEHYIEWISLETKQGRQFKRLAPGEEPRRTFALAEGDEVISALAYCNLHGLWKAE